jgi:Tetratricopeptide repeat
LFAAANQVWRHPLVRALALVVAIFVFAWAIWDSGLVAFSRLLVKYAIITSNVPALDKAISLTPGDAEAHYSRAALSNNMDQPEVALKELEIAISLRPRDYYLWLELGLVRDQLGDTKGALSAFDESARLAPYYAQPRWQRGNLLFRMGRLDEAFAELRNGAGSNPELLPSLIDLAWGASGKNPAVTEQLVQIRNDAAHLAMARFYAKHGEPDEAVAHFKSVAKAPESNRRELIQELLANSAFKQAFEIWSSANSPQTSTDRSKTTIYDGGFEAALSFDEIGFGWRLAPSQPGLALSQDTSEPQTGLRSLRVDFAGNSNPETAIVSQLVLAQPAMRYKLSFATRSQNIVTGGPPVLVVTDAGGARKQLARSMPLPQGTSGWQTSTLEFATEASTNAVLISLQREACANSPCPIFGSLNLDSFSLGQIK